MKTLEGNVAIVTGGSKGIGKSIGLALAAAGANVVLASRTVAELDRAAAELRAAGHAVDAVATDITSEAEVRRLVNTAIRRHGKVDILVNNAGIGIFKPVAELTAFEFDAMWSVNMRGAFLATREVLPHMIRASSGTLVFISSLAGKNSFKGGAGYCATKWAMQGFAGSLMLEVRDRNIRVVTVCPGSVDTTFSSSGKRGEAITQPEDVAAAVVFAVTAPARSMFSEIDVRPTNPA